MARIWNWLAGLAFAACQAVCPAFAGETITDSKFGFTLNVPDGFKPNVNPHSLPNILYAYVREKSAESPSDMYLFVEDLKGIIPQTPLDPKGFPPGFKGKLFTMPWQGLKVDTISVPEVVENVNVLTLNAQIPLRKRAIQIRLFGHADNETELKQILAKTLEGLNGESNWSASPGNTNPGSPEAQERDLKTNYIVKLGIGLVSALVLFYFASRTLPRGGLLLLAVCIYWLSWSIPTGQNREMHLIVGTLRFTGFIGMVLGAIDFFRKRKTKQVTPRIDEVKPA
jgi:hypothetical protein